MKKLILITVVFFCLVEAYGISGKLLIIGGGREESGMESWNGEAYKWAVDQSANKRVAVISFSNSSTWLSEHFVSDWGASQSKIFVINNVSQADDQATYDSLMNYDVIFLKGGNQYNYYSVYNDTKTEQAITDKFNEGGVICGTSAGLAVLGGVDFTAESGTVYSYECLEDWDNSYVQLADDFLPLLDGFIFDSHFVQRGRFPRLLAFMAHWQTKHSISVSGIGVDDKMALAIDDNMKAVAYGSGCVSIYYTDKNSVLNQSKKTLLIDSVKVIQLIDNTSVDLTNFQVEGFDNSIQPVQNEESGNYTVLASGGSNEITENAALLNRFYNLGNEESSILILTDNVQDTADLYEDKLVDLGAESVRVFPATSVYSENTALKEAIDDAGKVLFVKNSWNELKAFLSTDNGSLLKDKIQKQGMISAFIGDNSRYAGQVVVVNYEDPDASYDGLYQYESGLGLLSTTVIIPRTFDPAFATDYSQYENTIAAIPNAMVQNSLTYGIWLSRNNYLVMQPENGENLLTCYGDWPVMILRNNGTLGEAVSKGVYGNSSQVRMLSGFEEMTLSVIDSTTSYKMGNTEEATYIHPSQNLVTKVQIRYRSFNNSVYVDWPEQRYTLKIYDLQGIPVLEEEGYGEEVIPVNELLAGIYIVQLENQDGMSYVEKIYLH